jgi:hypothetical protein
VGQDLALVQFLPLTLSLLEWLHLYRATCCSGNSLLYRNPSGRALRLTLANADRREDDEDYHSPGMPPTYDNRSPSPQRPIQSYQLQDQPYRPQLSHLQMPMASSDRLAAQPTVSISSPQVVEVSEGS